MSALKTKRSLGANPLVSPAPSFLIGSYDAAGKPNVMTAAWAGICSSKPLSIAVGVRPERWSHEAILARKAFTVGHAPVSLMAEADFAGMASGRDRTFSVPVYGPDTSQAYAAANRECQRMALHAKLLRNDGSRLVFECVSELQDKP